MSRVDVEEIQTKIERLRVGPNSPRSRRKGGAARRKLFDRKRENVPWSKGEDHALVKFVLLHSDGGSWPSHKDDAAF